MKEGAVFMVSACFSRLLHACQVLEPDDELRLTRSKFISHRNELSSLFCFNANKSTVAHRFVVPACH